METETAACEKLRLLAGLWGSDPGPSRSLFISQPCPFIACSQKRGWDAGSERLERANAALIGGLPRRQSHLSPVIRPLCRNQAGVRRNQTLRRSDVHRSHQSNFAVKGLFDVSSYAVRKLVHQSKAVGVEIVFGRKNKFVV